MSESRLHDDLMQEYREEKKFVSHQLEILEPLGVQLRKPAAQRLLNKSILVVYEILCYLLFAGAIAFALFFDRIYPFDLIGIMSYRTDVSEALGKGHINQFYYAFIGVIGLIAILFLILARAARSFRLKNNILNLAGKSLKETVGQLLQRNAAINAIDQRHFNELPQNYGSYEKINVNDVLNPGYDDAL